MRGIATFLCALTFALVFIQVADALAGEPARPKAPWNRPAAVAWDAATGRISLQYHGRAIFEGEVKAADGGAVEFSEGVERKAGITQRLVFRGRGLKLGGTVRASNEAFPCETRGAAQQVFPLVRTSNGLSRSLRNNAVYDRKWDWELELPAAGAARITPMTNATDGRTFSLTCAGDLIELIFRPRYYQKHKNLKFFKPWTYRPREHCPAGWCSWWAYRRDFDEQRYRDLVEVWGEKRLPDFGYRVLQIDDTYQQENETVVTPGTVKSWLAWNGRFPGGMEEYARLAKSIGADPGVWVSLCFNDPGYVQAHPELFIRNGNGEPYRGRWISYAIDATVPKAADELIRPIYRGFKQTGFSYVKIDTVRHLLYDNAHLNPEYAKSKGMNAADIARRYFEVAREEAGPDTFILACWGVLPQVVGLADGCRLGGDGYGPQTLQQYNSWNGIVWYNDPDHCDVRPDLGDQEDGNAAEPVDPASAESEAILRPMLASVAGAMLMLSDKTDVYRDDANLEGAKRAAPILPTVPGQLYDFDPTTSDKLKTIAPETITSGADDSPYDARKTGEVCQWWLNEIDRPFEHWTVLTRMNWTDEDLPAAEVRFADLGLAPEKDYLVFEFWTKAYLGVRTSAFQIAACEPKGIRTFAIRERLDRPQIVSTSRHISQGGVDIVSLDWQDNALLGTSKVVAGDRYELAIRMPKEYSLVSASFDGRPAETEVEGELQLVSFTPSASQEVHWRIEFSRTK